MVILMCGIIGVLANDGKEKIINGLLNMEYRGYDSCGIAYFFNDEIKIEKRVESPKSFFSIEDSFNIGIGHTRWATHGKVNCINAHPVSSFDSKVFIVHNGVIENSNFLKKEYLSDIIFKTETDTEVLVNLIAKFFKDFSLIESVEKATKLIDGSYAFLLLCPNTKSIYCACNNMPLLIGISDESIIIASDVLAFSKDIYKYYRLPDNFIAEINKTTINEFPFSLFNFDNSFKSNHVNKHHMIEEILYEPIALKKMYEKYFVDNKEIKKILRKIKRKKTISFIASGSSYNACKIGEKYVNSNLKIRANTYLASEFIYSDEPKSDIYFIVSQSGETADTIKALKKIGSNAFTISLTNVNTSTIAKMCKYNFDMLCGREISVASTKAFMSSIFFFYLLFNKENKYIEIINSITEVIKDKKIIKEFAESFKDKNNLIFLGRGFDGLINNENILKIKEITYLNVESYYGGELKHGPLALINQESIVFVINTNINTNNIMRANTEEVLARGGKCYLFSSIDNKEDADFYSFTASNEISIFQTCIYFQLFAYYLALSKNNNPDRPKNLAKSVTVE